MFDAALRRIVDPPLDAAGRLLAGRGVPANAVTLAGFAVGMAAVPALAFGRYDLALAAIVLNRLADGLDGAVARASEPTDLGGYLDIVLDFLFYGAVVLGFALGRPQEAVWSTFLIFSFVGSGTSFLAYAIIAAKRGVTTGRQGRKSIYYLGGLAEGSETIAAFALMCLFPQAFPWIAGIFGTLCLITAAGRIAAAVRAFRAR